MVTVSMRVIGLATGQVRATGQCALTVELLGRRRIQTPAGWFGAYVVRTIRHLDLSIAKSTIVMHTAHAVDHGLVARRVERTTRVLGLFETDVEEEIRLAEPAPAPPARPATPAPPTAND